MTLIAKLGRKLRDFGVLGVIELIIHKLCGFPKELLAFHPGLPYPIRLRFDTTDMMVFEDVIIRQDYSFGLPSSAKVIVDAGANIGLTSLFYASRFPEAKIFAIEAEDSNFELLLKNVRPYPNITPIYAALWHSEDHISVSHPPSDPFGHWGFAVSGVPGNVCAITFASLLRDFGLEYIDLLKVNIEGSEKEVFESFEWQDRVGSVVIELHDHFRPGCSEAVDRALREFSRSTWSYLTWYQKEGMPSNH